MTPICSLVNTALQQLWVCPCPCQHLCLFCGLWRHFCLQAVPPRHIISFLPTCKDVFAEPLVLLCSRGTKRRLPKKRGRVPETRSSLCPSSWWSHCLLGWARRKGSSCMVDLHSLGYRGFLTHSLQECVPCKSSPLGKWGMWDMQERISKGWSSCQNFVDLGFSLQGLLDCTGQNIVSYEVRAPNPGKLIPVQVLCSSELHQLQWRQGSPP